MKFDMLVMEVRGNEKEELSLFDWIHSNCIASSTHDHNIPWQFLFSFGIWSLWLRRNQFVFKPDSHFLDPVVNAISYASDFFLSYWQLFQSKTYDPYAY